MTDVEHGASSAPPHRLLAAVALIAAAMVLTEIVMTRLFSVLFYYHYSFFAISLVMSGLSLGGLLVARWNVRQLPVQQLFTRLAMLALLCAAFMLLALSYFVLSPTVAPYWNYEQTHRVFSLAFVLGLAASFVPGLSMAGALLATAFASHARWIGRLYASDLAAASLGCIGAVLLMRTVPGPVAMLLPVLLAAVAAMILQPRRKVILAGACALCLVVVLDAAGSFRPAPELVQFDWEGWNEHSRVIVKDQRIVIDRTAATPLCAMPPYSATTLPAPQPDEFSLDTYAVYHLGRPLREIAVIGAGGGRDVAAALASGAQHVDGYELNGLIIDLVKTTFAHVCGIASYPGVSLLHQEGRLGIGQSRKQYDVIQASLIDTWASTASGGFVLSENALYTLEGWQSFLAALSDSGVLTMTRWLLPDSPAEAHRLTSLASATLIASGIARPRDHIILLTTGRASELHHAGVRVVTILVSRTPFTSDEVTRLQQQLDRKEMHLLAAPGVAAADPGIEQLLEPATHAAAVAASPYDISVPRDTRPYFFLQLRLRDIPRLFGEHYNYVLEITFQGVRLLFILGGCATVFALLVLLLGFFTLPSAQTSAPQQRIYHRMTFYFFGIGLGYMLVQLGLHSRLIILLGHPSLALSVVLFSMLLGSGLGAEASRRLFRDGRFGQAWASILVAIAALGAAFPLLPFVEKIGALGGRITVAAAICLAVGFPLGFAFPIGVRIVSATGEWAVQKMWAVNGAASILGTVLAVILAISSSSVGVLIGGLVCYLAATLGGMLALRVAAKSQDDARICCNV
ncbi:MAG: hypothetical protein JXR83_07955 [Deltaproteobacteria bacterium]|nr:hypothetical protein [Deltaproteobacteria bacterium]